MTYEIFFSITMFNNEEMLNWILGAVDDTPNALCITSRHGRTPTGAAGPAHDHDSESDRGIGDPRAAYRRALQAWGGVPPWTLDTAHRRDATQPNQ